jgi:glycosyltransferase involved in cell wall biosynthesis
LIAKQLKDRYGVKWIADLRDLWTQDHYRSYGPLRKCFEKRLELKTLSSADALVTVSTPLAEELGSLHGRSDISIIQNGFDPEEMGQVELTKEFTITYTGRFLEGKRDPYLLLQALKELKETGKIDLSVVRVRFFGSSRKWLEGEIAEYDMRSIAKQYGHIPRDEVVPKQRESQVLLLLNWDDPRDKGVYTGKIFEYLAAGRPILAIGGPEGVVSELLKKTGAGAHVRDLKALKEKLLEYYEEYISKGSVGFNGVKEEIDKFSYREMARKFAEVIEKVSRER